MALDLSTILGSIDNLQLVENGAGFLFRADGGVYVPPREEKEPTEWSHFFSAGNTQGGTLAIDAVDAWKNAGRPEDRALRFTSGERAWWGGYSPLYPDDEAAWLGVALPLDDLVTLLQRRWQLVLAIALVVAIECERAGDPAFLTHRQGESFYIRSGPSNMELTISQALSYLRRRF